MVIKRGAARGNIGEDNNLKVHFSKDKESAWVRVIAMHVRKKKGIGILLNNLFSGRMKWGKSFCLGRKNLQKYLNLLKKWNAFPALLSGR